jgi:DNA-binding transcriptional LysR family regulator
MPEFDALQIRRLDGGLLLIFRELLLRRRASAVADHLGLSPSAISHALVRLREAFGDPLFIRRSHGLEPTQRAIEMGPKIEAVIALLGEAINGDTGFDPAGSHRRFRIVGADHLATLIAPPLVEIFRREAPNATFSVRPAYLAQALRAVQRDEADIALGVFDQTPRGLVATRLFEDDYCVIARAGHPTVAGTVDLETYATIGHVFIGNPDGLLADELSLDTRAMAANYGKLPGPEVVRTHAYLIMWESVMLLVGESDVLAECPRRLATRYADRLGLQILDPPTAPFRMAVQAVRRSDAPDAAVDWLMDKLVGIFAEPSADAGPPTL